MWDGIGLKEFICRPHNMIGSPNQRPSNVITGTMFKNTEIGKWEIFNGSSWENLDTPTNEWATIE